MDNVIQPLSHHTAVQKSYSMTPYIRRKKIKTNYLILWTIYQQSKNFDKCRAQKFIIVAGWPVVC